jgi:hypothetical protein
VSPGRDGAGDGNVCLGKILATGILAVVTSAIRVAAEAQNAFIWERSVDRLRGQVSLGGTLGRDRLAERREYPLYVCWDTLRKHDPARIALCEPAPPDGYFPAPPQRVDVALFNSPRTRR